MFDSRRSISVTLKNITDSIEASSSHCMVADAIKRSFAGEIRNVSVDIQTIRWSNPKKRERYIFLTPASVQRAIIKFDEGRKPKPFRFYLRGGQIIKMKEWTEEDAKRMQEHKNRPQIVPGKDNHLTTIKGGTAPRLTHVGKRRAYGLHSIKAIDLD